MWEFLQKLKQLQPESKNIVLTGLTGEVLGEKALVSNGKLVWASVAGGFLEQHDQQMEHPRRDEPGAEGEQVCRQPVQQQKKALFQKVPVRKSYSAIVVTVIPDIHSIPPFSTTSKWPCAMQRWFGENPVSATVCGQSGPAFAR